MESTRRTGGTRDVIRLRDDYYILASSSLTDDRTRVLKHGETFAVLDRWGDIHPVGRGQQGLYHEGTRHLSRLELRVAGERPILLSSTVTEDNAQVAVDLTNPLLGGRSDGGIAQDSIHLFRSCVVWAGACYQRLRIRNYALEATRLSLCFRFAADFVDIFEVRGFRRKRSGQILEPRCDEDRVRLSYRGLDGRLRCSELCFTPRPEKLRADEVCFSLSLEPRAEAVVTLSVRCLDSAAEEVPRLRFEQAFHSARAALAAPAADGCRVDSSNEQFNDWLNRSAADLRMMLTDTEHGRVPYAGVPWFSAPFGRDGLITAFQTLWMNPSIAAGVLRFLSATQAQERSRRSEAEPGRILHEARGGELAALGEVPFRRYYGTVDATPLFVMLAHAYWERTADRDLLERIWPHVLRALDWIEQYGDRDGDGFVEYERQSAAGLVNQGWKDSGDAIFHADGRLAEGPIALCEVQAYVYGALHGAAELARAMGDGSRTDSLQQQADALRARFEERFWCEEIGSYALALDGDKQPCRVSSSNSGQCLLTGIASFPRAQRVAEQLLGPELFSGWGIRTVASSQRRYNPMSYHNGSVWPHDNSLVAAGLARYGLMGGVLRILTGLFDATLFLDLHRMPELFCGFPRRPGEGPTLYPVACAPQAWSAASVYLLLASCLGIRISAQEGRILFANPVLPPFLDSLRLRELRVGAARIDLQLHRHPDDVGIQVLRREGDLDVVVVK